jgi:hypothetical protein
MRIGQKKRAVYSTQRLSRLVFVIKKIEALRPCFLIVLFRLLCVCVCARRTAYVNVRRTRKKRRKKYLIILPFSLSLSLTLLYMWKDLRDIERRRSLVCDWSCTISRRSAPLVRYVCVPCVPCVCATWMMTHHPKQQQPTRGHGHGHSHTHTHKSRRYRMFVLEMMELGIDKKKYIFRGRVVSA